MLDPSRIKIPTSIESERLIIRAPEEDDAPQVREAIEESLASLRPWMIWTHDVPTLQDQQNTLKLARERFEKREDFWLFLFDKHNGRFIGGSGLHNPDWEVPKFEIGYWVRSSCSGKGYVTEAVRAISDFAFETLRANRVYIRMSSKNEKSWRVAERAGFTLEAILRNDSRELDGSLRDTRIYAKIRKD